MEADFAIVSKLTFLTLSSDILIPVHKAHLGKELECYYGIDNILGHSVDHITQNILHLSTEAVGY